VAQCRLLWADNRVFINVDGGWEWYALDARHGTAAAFNSARNVAVP
jgi:hypothetical protein